MVANWRVWLSTKLNPAQPAIAAMEITASPESIVEYEDAYNKIDVVHRAIDLIINGCVEVPLEVEGGAAKKIYKLLNDRPNPFEDRVRFFRRAFLDFILDGNAFFYYDQNSLYLLPANDVEVVPHEKKFVDRYDYLITTTNRDHYSFSRTTKQTRLSFKPDEIIHIKGDNNESIYRGTSKLKNMQRLFELYYHLTNFQRQFFKNNAIPGIVLATEHVLSDKIKNRLLEHWRQHYTTLFEGARNPAILDGGLKIDKFSQVNFQELDFEQSIERLQQDIAKSLGVPFVLLKSGNNANIGANEVLFYNHTILPMLQQFCSAFMLMFDGSKIYPDRLAVPALQPDNKTQALYYSTLVNTGIITPNEARDGLRFPIRDESAGDDLSSDKLRIPQNIVGSATNPSVGGRPSQGPKSPRESEPTTNTIKEKDNEE